VAGANCRVWAPQVRRGATVAGFLPDGSSTVACGRRRCAVARQLRGSCRTVRRLSRVGAAGAPWRDSCGGCRGTAPDAARGGALGPSPRSDRRAVRPVSGSLADAVVLAGVHVPDALTLVAEGASREVVGFGGSGGVHH